MALGFNNTFEAQIAIDNADLNLAHRHYSSEDGSGIGSKGKHSLETNGGVRISTSSRAQILIWHYFCSLQVKHISPWCWYNWLPVHFLTRFPFSYFYEPFLPISMRCFQGGTSGYHRCCRFQSNWSTLPQALRLARTEAAGLRLFQIEGGDLPKEGLVPQLGITGRKSTILARNAEVVAELENLFSWKYVTCFAFGDYIFFTLDWLERRTASQRILD